MRRLITGMTLLACGILFTACGRAPQKEGMYLKRAELTQEEENIAKLLGGQQDIYDFKVDDTVRALEINIYRLSDGEWRLFSGGRQQMEDEEGRIALAFDDLAEGLRVSVQSEGVSGSSSYTTEPEEKEEGCCCTTARLEELSAVTYEEEIPLLVQIFTQKDTVYSYQVDYFFKPEEYEKHGYETVYAVTVKFSQNPLQDETADF